MNFHDLFSDYKAAIQKRLEEFIDEKRSDYEKRFGKNDEFFTHFKAFVTSGKMIRGSLFLLSAESNGFSKKNEIIDIACSLELMHSALLIHDDIMDNDEMRRGLKTVFSKYKELAVIKNIKDTDHYGISMGIVIGDIALFMAEEIAISYGNKNLHKLLKFYTQELRLVGIGQMLDFDYGAKDAEVMINDIEKMYIYKSARYSFTLPLCMGAIVAGADQSGIEVLGEKLGLIFQLIDDDIGMFGSEEEIGKPIGSDIKENKKTYMRALLNERIDGETKKELAVIFGNSHIGMKEIEKIKILMQELKVRQDIFDKINSLHNEALGLINDLNISVEYKTVYRQLLEYLSNREK